MPITFKSLKPDEYVDVAGFTIRKHNCLTVAEEIEIRDLGSKIDEELKNLTPLQADLELKQRIITILFQSRLDREWTIEKTKAAQWEVEADGQIVAIEPTMEMLDALYEFFMLEQRRGKSIEEIQETPVKEEKKRNRLGRDKADAVPAIPA